MLIGKRFVSVLLLTCLGPGASTARADKADPWFGRDKASHFSISLALAVGGYEAGAGLFRTPPPRLATGAVVALSAGVAKELMDRRGGGDPSWRDFSWDVIGTATGLAVAWLIDTYAFRTKAK